MARTTEIDEKFKQLCDTPSDINEHLPTLYSYACKVDSIVEFGVRHAISTWAFIRGLRDGKNGRHKRLVCVDLERSPEIDDVERACQKCNIFFQFHKKSDLEIQLESPVDLLFIDTWHVYGQLKRELKKHAGIVKKFILLHDTEVDGELGESVRLSVPILKLEQQPDSPDSRTPPEWRWKDYVALNPDLVKAGILTRAAALQHWIDYGHREERSYNKVHLGIVGFFDQPISKQSSITGIPEDEIKKGLRYAVDEFLKKNDSWSMHAHFFNDNGLSILARNTRDI